MIPVQVADGEEIALTPGAHSELIKEIITQFSPRFAPGAEVIYVGDTGDKAGYFQRERLASFGVEADERGKLPDVVLYYRGPLKTVASGVRARRTERRNRNVW
ncbi:MAG: hypothetical protein GKR94_32290 [Gammaproteobacteria bacterium]|nr:hypothetical protein [Gammaproteobacteria bacterium]